MGEEDIQVSLGEDLNNNMFANDESQTNTTASSMKSIIKPIVIIVILLAILFFAYYFFFGRYVEVTFSVLSIGKSAMTTITLMQDGKVYDEFNTDEPVKVLPGDYEININDPSLSNLYFPASTKFVNISKDGSVGIEIKLYPEWAGNLHEFKLLNKPTSMFEGQTIDLSLSIVSDNKVPKSITIIGLGNDLNGIEEFWTVKPGPNTTTIKFQNTKKYTNSAKVSGSFSIEDAPTSLQIPFSVEVKKSPTLTISGNTSYNVSAGQDLTIVLDLSNQSKTDKIELLNLEINNSTPIDPNTIESWIKTKSQDVNVPHNGKTSANLTMTIPLATSEKDISFDLYFKNSYLNVFKNIKLSIKPPAIELPKTTDFGTIVSGESAKTKNIVFDNKTGFQIKINNTTVDITTPSPNNSIDALLQTIIVEAPEVVEANSKENVPVTIVMPPTFDTDTIKGTITFETDAGNFSTEFTMNIKGMIIKPEFEGINATYTLETDPIITSMTTANTKTFSIINKSNVELNFLNLQIKDCTTYLKVDLISFPVTILKDEKKDFFLTFIHTSKPPSPIGCSIIATYIDPRTNTEAPLEKLFVIN